MTITEAAVCAARVLLLIAVIICAIAFTFLFFSSLPPK